MLQRLYAHNYKCLENFELVTQGLSSVLLIGKNGSGKSTVRDVLSVFQRIGRGQTRVRELVSAKDFAHNKSDVPIRLELEVVLEEQIYRYEIAFELPENFKELRILEEQHGPIFCFWDEPDNYISLSEVGHFVGALRARFQQSGQILVTSHNPEAIRRFSNENTFVLGRKSHLEPTRIKLLEDIRVDGDLIDALICGDVTI